MGVDTQRVDGWQHGHGESEVLQAQFLCADDEDARGGRLRLGLPHVHVEVDAAAAQGGLVDVDYRLLYVGRGAGGGVEVGCVDLEGHGGVLAEHAVVGVGQVQLLDLYVEVEERQHPDVDVGGAGADHGVAGRLEHGDAVEADVKGEAEAEAVDFDFHPGGLMHLVAGYVLDQCLDGRDVQEPGEEEDEDEQAEQHFEGAAQPGGLYYVAVRLLAFGGVLACRQAVARLPGVRGCGCFVLGRMGAVGRVVHAFSGMFFLHHRSWRKL